MLQLGPRLQDGQRRGGSAAAVPHCQHPLLVPERQQGTASRQIPRAEGSRHPQDSHRPSLGRHWGSHFSHPTPAMLPASCSLSPFLPLPAHPPDFRASHVLPALRSRAGMSHPPSQPPASPFPSLFSIPRAPGFPPAPPAPGPQGSAGRVEDGACQSKQHTRRRRRAAEAKGRVHQPTLPPRRAERCWGGSFPSLSKCSKCSVQPELGRQRESEAILGSAEPGMLSGTSGTEHPLCHPSCGSELRGVREAKGKQIPGWSSPASNLKQGLFLPLCSLPGKAAGKYFPGNCFCSFLSVCTHEALLRLGHASTCPEAQINPLHRQGRQLRSDAVSRGEEEEEETFPLGNHIRSQPEQGA